MKKTKRKESATAKMMRSELKTFLLSYIVSTANDRELPAKKVKAINFESESKKLRFRFAPISISHVDIRPDAPPKNERTHNFEIIIFSQDCS